MKRTSVWMRAVSLFIAMLLSLPLQVLAQQEGGGASQKLSKEELAQLLAPIALYPDELVSQILMASTYPLEIVQADRWAKSHKQSAGEVLAKQLEKEPWDPSVKSLVNFPEVLAKMSEKLDLTTKIGDAFLSQQKDVMDTIQELRRKAYDAGNLKTTKEQKIVVEKEVIVIQPANPEVIYVPSYSTTVVYGAWPYPAYPPYYYYPPPPPAYPAHYFAAGVAVGLAWGYAWGSCNWNGGSVDYNVNQNININRNIDRGKYNRPSQQPGQGGRGKWQHNPQHRKGVAYKDKATATKYGQSGAKSMEGRRDSRGYGDGRGGGAGARPSAGTMDRGGQAGANRPGGGPSAGTMDRGGQAGANRGTDNRAGTGAGGGRDSAFSGGYGNGRQERMASDRGQASRQSSFGGGASRPSGGFGGGGGGFRGGGGGGFRGGGGRR